MSLSKCISKIGVPSELHTELRALARQYAKTMDVADAERRAAAEMLERVQEDLETVRDHLIAKGFPLEMQEPVKAKGEFRFSKAEPAPETVPPKNITFEVAPDPNNTELTRRWNAVDFEGRRAITDNISADIIPSVMRILGVRGAMAAQHGGYLENNNPSLALTLEHNNDLIPVAKDIGHVLAQDSMVVVSDTPMKGLDANGAAIIVLPKGYTQEQVAILFDRLRSLKGTDGNTMVDGHTTKNGEMGLLNFTDLDNDEFVRTIHDHLGGEFDVKPRTIYSTLIPHQEYGHGDSSSRSSRHPESVQRELDNLRRRAASLLDSALAERERGGERGRFSLAGAGTDDGGRGREAGEPAGRVPQYGQALDGATSVLGVHYSQDRRTSLDANKYGTGIKGAEAQRLTHAKDERLKSRTYFYVDENRGIRPEPGLGAHRHEVRLNNLYDPKADPKGIVRAVADDLSIPDADFQNAWESAILDAGYDGYYVRSGMGQMGVAVVIGQKHDAIPVAHKPEVRFSLSNSAGATTDREVADAQKQWAEKGVESPYFKKWFGDSKVVDADGKPLVVYHGSMEKRLDSFDHEKTVEVHGGFFFTDNESVADQYTYERAYGDIISDGPIGSVVEAYLRLVNPMEYTLKPGQKIVDAIEMSRAIKAAKDNGHDGLVIRNIDDSIGMTGDMGDVYVAFDPTQIKSVDNRGTFDANDKRIRFSLSPQERSENDVALGRTLPQTVDDAQKVGAMKVINAVIGNAKMPRDVRKDMGALKQMFMQNQQVANRYEEAAELLRINEEAEEARTEGRHKMLDPVLKAMEGLSDVQEAQLAQIVHALDGEQLKGVNASKFSPEKVGDITRYHLNEQHYTEMRAALKGAGVADHVADAYIAIRKSLDMALAQTFEKMQELRVDANVIDRMRSSIGQLQNYFPHMRFGDHYINVTNADGETIYNEHVEAGLAGKLSPQLARRIELVKGAYPEGTVTWGKMRDVPESVFEKGIDTAKLVQIVNAAVDRMKDADPNVQDSLRTEISRHISQVLLARGWGRHAMKRKGIPGYEMQDVRRVLVNYHSGHQGWLAKIDKAHKFSVAMGEIDARKTPGLYDWSRHYVTDMLRNQDAWDRRSALLRSILSVWYIGGRISSALVNLTQNLIATLPVLSIESGMLRATTTYLKNAGRTIAYSLSGDEAKARHMNPGELAFLQEFHDKGITADRFMRDIAGVESTDTANAMRNVASKLMTPFMIVERFNRASTALAAYRMARDGKIDNPKTLERYGKKKGEKFSEIDARDFARTMVNDAHFLPGKDNLPQAVRSGPAAWRAVATALYTFKGYPHALMGMWRRMLTKQGGRGVAAFGYSMAATAALGGAMAIPFLETLAAALRGVTGEDPERWLHKEMRALTDNDAIHDAVFYGVGALDPFNVTLKNSMDMNLPIVGDIKENKPATQQIIDKTFESLLGVPLSFVKQAGRAYEHALNGNTYRAIETASPAFVASVMKAVRLNDEGATDSSGRPMAAPGQREQFKLEGGEVVAQALGFNPVSKQKMQDASMSVQRMDEQKQAVQARLVKRYVQAKKAGDDEAVQALIEERNAFNAKMREGGHTGLLIKEPLAKLARDYQKPKKVSATKAGEYRDAGAAYGVE